MKLNNDNNNNNNNRKSFGFILIESFLTRKNFKVN
jgi:hypothetical protein